MDNELFDFCKDNFIIGSIGRLSLEKGFDYLIDAFNLCVRDKDNIDAKMVIIGEGGERKRLEARLEQYGINNQVIMPGYRNNAIHFLPLFDVFVLPSLTEGLPITLIEAMQAGLPCIATKVGGVPEVLSDGECGLLVDPKNAKMIYKGIKELYHSKEKRKKIGVMSKDRVLKEFSAQKMTNNYLCIYRELMN